MDIPTPSVRLEVNGAIKVGESDVNLSGTIRWNAGRLEGRHNGDWSLLDISSADNLESKWTLNDAEDGIYVENRDVLINTYVPMEMLTVSGDVSIEDQLLIGGDLVVSDELIINDDYGVFENMEVIASKLTLDASNTFDFDTGLTISGVYYGDGSGIVDIRSDSLKIGGIDGSEIADYVILGRHILSNSLSGDTIASYSITSDLLSADFQLTNEHLVDLIVTNNHFQSESLFSSDFSDSFELLPVHFEDQLLVSFNIGAQEIDGDKVNDDELVAADFSSSFIDATVLIGLGNITSNHIVDESIGYDHFVENGLTYSHLDTIFDISFGGTNQDSYGDIGELVVVSNNQFVSVSTFVLNEYGLGINTTQNVARLHVNQDQDGIVPISIQTDASAASANILFQNDFGQWLLGINSDDDFFVENNILDAVVFRMDESGNIGVYGDISDEKVTLSGALHLGDQTVDSVVGSIYFSEADSEFKLVTDSDTYTIDDSTTDYAKNGIDQSFLFTSSIYNDSLESNVLLGSNLYLFGSNHMIKGAQDSVVSGNEQFLTQVIHSTIYGQENMISMVEGGMFLGYQMILDLVMILLF